MKLTVQQKQSSGKNSRDLLNRIAVRARAGSYSVCSAHPWVIEAAIQTGDARQHHFSCGINLQPGQSGGRVYRTVTSGVRGFRYSTAMRAGFSVDQLVLGGDHLGPYPWRNQDASIAMEKAYDW